MDTKYDIKKTEMTDFSLVKFLDIKLMLDVIGSTLDWQYIENKMKNKSIYDSINFTFYFLKKIYPEYKGIYFPINLPDQWPINVDEFFKQKVLDIL